MTNKDKTVRQRSSGWDEGDCLSHMPAATSEQLTIAKILHRPGNDSDLKTYVAQLRELTQCTEDQAVTALYDCENNLAHAVELLLDKFRYGKDDEWQKSVGKRAKTRVRLNTDTTLDESSVTAQHKESDITVNDRDSSQPEKRVLATPSVENKVKKERKTKKIFPNRSSRVADANDQNNYKSSKVAVPKSDRFDMGERNNKERSGNELDGWDPYTEYGEWTGELIEVVNSDVNIAKGLEDCLVLHSDLLVETDSESIRPTIEDETTNDQGSHEPVCVDDSYDDPNALFIKTARSKRPLPAFSKSINVDLLFAPGLLPDIKLKSRYMFGGDWAAQVFASNGRTNDVSSLHKTVDHTDQPTFNSPRNSSSNTIITTKNKSGNLESSTTLPDKTVGLPPSLTANNISASSANIKSDPLYQDMQKRVPNLATLSESNTHEPSPIDSTFKDYMLDNVECNSSKMSVEQEVSNSDNFVQRPTTSNSHIAGQAFITSNSALAPPNPTQKNVVSHGSAHSQTTTSHTQQSSTIPHPLPHFVGQFTPSPYVFNMPGSSGNPPTLFELDQIQLLQQHRMLYDMHLQQQVATTVQNVLPLSETSSAGKNSAQGVPAPLTHATAGNTIRPDIITSAVGHATQLMQSGHPYFHYPRFVLMNGYHNAYLNQQQTGQEGSSGVNTSSPMSNAAVIHGALPVTQQDGQSQSYNNMKVPHTYNDFLDLKYGDPSKQVGFKSVSGQPHQQPYVPFTGQGIATTEAAKPLPPSTLNQAAVAGGVASSAGYPTAVNAVQYSQQQQQQQQHPQQQQFYPPVGASQYFTAAAVAAAAVAAASAQQQQQQQQQHVMGGPGSQPPGGAGGSAAPNQVTHMHPSAGGPTMVYPGAGLHVHHGGQQRSAIPH